MHENGNRTNLLLDDRGNICTKVIRVQEKRNKVFKYVNDNLQNAFKNLGYC
jgi:hypothetical protein